MAREKLWTDELDYVLSALEGYPRLGSIAVAHRGARWIAPLPRPLWDPESGEPYREHDSGVRRASDLFEPYFVAGDIEDLGESYAADRGGDGLPWHLPKIIVHWSRSGDGTWPITAVPDLGGLIAFDEFYGVWPTGNVPAQVLAAVLNGPVANAYLAALGGPGGDVSDSLEDVPIPPVGDDLALQLVDMVGTYRSERAHLGLDLTQDGIDRCLTLPGAIEDIVLKAYGLPPAAEARLLGNRPRPARPGFERVAQIAREAPSPLPTRQPESMSPEEIAAWQRSIEEADAAMEADLKKFEERLRSEQPEFFDASGRIRTAVIQRRMIDEAAHRRARDQRELAALMRRRGRQTIDAT